LTVAKERGLQFAIFNSCSGLSIANKLIDLGLSQVAVMREPIHNRVAEEFLVLFLQALTQYKNVHESVLAACEYLKLEKNLTYPSSYLIPSLFRHPEAALFRLEPFGLKQRLKQLIPTRREAIALTSLILISLQLPVQQFLLERRVLVQAIYRQVTHQFEKVTTPPVLLVQIDEQSIQKAKIQTPIVPMDRKYLARLVDKLNDVKARVVGIDYLLDRNQEQSDRILVQSLHNAVRNSAHPTWFVFATTRDQHGQWLNPLPDIASRNWSLQGEIDILPGYMQLFPFGEPNSEPLFFAGLLAISHQLQQISNSVQPQLNSRKDFIQQIRSSKEATAIAPLLKTQPLIGKDATKSAVLQHLPTARIVHFATHGILDDAQGLNSAIALAPSPSSEGKQVRKDNDGLLTANEILDLKLNAELVVLSACDTGRGRIS
jgi:hypothetical protein